MNKDKLIEHLSRMSKMYTEQEDYCFRTDATSLWTAYHGKVEAYREMIRWIEENWVE